MPVEQLTYGQIAERLGVSSEAARALAKRMRLPRSRANDGKTLVAVDLAEIQHKPLPSGRSPRGDQPVTDIVAALKAKIEILEAELAKTEERSAGHRADFERERARVDQLMSELLTATADLMAARTVAARLEGEIAVLRDQAGRSPAGHPRDVARYVLARAGALTADDGVRAGCDMAKPKPPPYPKPPRPPPEPPRPQPGL